MKKFLLSFFGLIFILVLASNAINAAKNPSTTTSSPSPEPSSAPAETSPSPEPSPSPSPSPSGLSAESQLYIAEASTISMSTGEQLETFSEIFETPQEVFTDNSVRIRLAGTMAVIKVNNEKMQKLKAPTAMKDLDGDLKKAHQLYAESMDVLAEGIDEMSTTKITRATALMNDGTESINSARVKIEAMKQ